LKVIRTGHAASDDPDWFVGAELECAHTQCRSVFMPESLDDVFARYKAVREVVFECPVCHELTWFHRNKLRTATGTIDRAKIENSKRLGYAE
jgi:hypothetical protein